MDVYSLLKPLLFQVPAEKAHHLTLQLLKKSMHWPFVRNQLMPQQGGSHQPVQIGGLTFPNPVGLAAGLDKNGEVFNEMGDLGFGMVEIGTVTPRPQSGNAKPRLFRLPKDQALINRMGFNNDGVDAIRERLKNRRKDLIIGGNVGKNKDTPNEDASSDYAECFDQLWDWVDYFTINVSSPNTPGLRDLQQKSGLDPIFTKYREKEAVKGHKKPVFLKIAPDLEETQLKHIVELANTFAIDAIIATNTTIDRTNLKTSSEKLDQIGNGGLSGAPLKNKATAVLSFLKEESGGKLPLIASGGIMSPEDAREKLEAGASVVQLYSGLIYKGPYLIKEILEKTAAVGEEGKR